MGAFTGIYLFFLFLLFKPSHRDGCNLLIQYKSSMSSSTFVTPHVFSALPFAVLINCSPPARQALYRAKTEILTHRLHFFSFFPVIILMNPCVCSFDASGR